MDARAANDLQSVVGTEVIMGFILTHTQIIATVPPKYEQRSYRSKRSN